MICIAFLASGIPYPNFEFLPEVLFSQLPIMILSTSVFFNARFCPQMSDAIPAAIGLENEVP